MKHWEEYEPTRVGLVIASKHITSTYLDLQDVIAADALVVHLMVGIISVTSVLVLDEGEATRRAY